MLNAVPDSFPFGGLVYLRSQWTPSHQLLPFAFVACKPVCSSSQQRSWLAVPSFKVRWPSSTRPNMRQLTALELYNGYLKELMPPPNAPNTYPLPSGYHMVCCLNSSPNPLWPLPAPWTVVTESILLSDDDVVHSPYSPISIVNSRRYFDT